MILMQTFPDHKKFEYELFGTQQEIRNCIRECEGKHVQQACFSSFMDSLTQICFTCQKIRSTVEWDGNKSWNIEPK